MPRPNELLADDIWRYGKRVSTALARMRKGESLHCEASQADGTAWWLEPSGKSVGPVTASRVIALPEVVAEGDGLLDGASQTYRYRSAK